LPASHAKPLPEERWSIEMGKSDKWSNKFDELRRKAVQILTHRQTESKDFTDTDMIGLIHELEVHEVELQIQNEELRSAKIALEESRNRYAALYDHAPVGYVNLDSQKLIASSNVAAKEILGIPVNLQYKYRFYAFIHPEDQGKLWNLFREDENSWEKRSCEIRIARGSEAGAPRFIQMEAAPSTDAGGRFNGWLVAFVDITERKGMELRDQDRTVELSKANRALKDSEKQLRYLSSRILSAHEEERKRIAHELHDSIGGTLSAIKFGIENVLARMREGTAAPEDLEGLVDTTQNCIEEARRIYMDLRPSVLDDLGLIAAIRWFTRQFQASYPGIRVDQHIELGEHEVPELLKIVFFRVMQEALHNVAKHSQAALVDLRLTKEDGRVTLVVSDNGVGFSLADPSISESGEKGIGLAGMQDRVESAGGALAIRSAKGMGTTIQAMWDLDDRFP
jgi:PAS domain S-box-containing protein